MTVRRRSGTVVLLAVVWVALWGDLSVGNALTGLVLGAAVLVLAPLPGQQGPRRLRTGAAVRYSLHFLRELVTATAEVARQVFWSLGRLRPGVVRVPLRTSDPGLVSLVANTITLTPGTLTLEVDLERRTLWVHALHLPDGSGDGVVESAHRLEELGAAALRVHLPPAVGAGR